MNKSAVEAFLENTLGPERMIKAKVVAGIAGVAAPVIAEHLANTALAVGEKASLAAGQALTAVLETSAVQRLQARGTGLIHEVVYQGEQRLGTVAAKAGKTLDRASRSRRIYRRNLPPELRVRREKAQAQMGTAAQRQMRQIFEEDPGGVVQALQLPDPREIENTFQAQARVGNGQEHNPYIPLAEQDPQIGMIEHDPEDKRIKKLRGILGVPIHPMVLKDQTGQAVRVYDRVRPERGDGSGRKLTGPLEPRVMDDEGNLVHLAEYRTVMVPNAAGAVARAELREMVHELGEDLTSTKTVAIIARLDTLAENQRDSFSPQFVAEVFSLARTTGYSPAEVVDRCLQRLDPFLSTGYFHNVDLRQPSNLESARKPPWWKKLLTRKQPIRVARFKPRKS